MKRAAIYCRTSSDDERDENRMSIQLQLKDCRMLAKQHGLAVTMVEEDRDRSGSLWPDVPEARFDKLSGTEYRRGFTKVVNAILEKRIDVLIVWNDTRIARPKSVKFIGWLFDDLFKSGITILTKEKGILDYNDFQTELLGLLNARMGRHEIDANARKSKEAKRILRQNGRMIGRVVFGYETHGKGNCFPHPTNAETVRMIYDMWTKKRYGYWRIGQALAKHGRTQGGGQTFWQGSTLKLILANPAYVGKWRDRDGTLKPSTSYPPILDEQTWIEAQSIHRESRGGPRRPEGYLPIDAPLTGVLRCGQCDSVLQYQRGRGGRNSYYRCIAPGCPNRESIMADIGHSLANAIVQAFADHPALLIHAQDAPVLYARLSELEAARLNYEKQMDDAVTTFAHDVSMMKKATDQIQLEITRVRKETEQLTRQLRSTYPADGTTRAKIKWLLRKWTVMDGWNDLHFQPLPVCIRIPASNDPVSAAVIIQSFKPFLDDKLSAAKVTKG